MFHTVFQSIIRSSKLHIQRQAFVRPILLPPASQVEMPNFMKICPVGAKLSHAEGQTEGRMDRHAERSKLIVAFRSSAQAPANTRQYSVSNICECNEKGMIGFGGLGVVCCPLEPKFAVSNPAEAVGFLGRKNSQHAFLRRGSKAVGPMS